MPGYLKEALKTTGTPQSQPLSGQTPNAAGGYTWDVDKWAQLHRFLILGAMGGTYYIGQRELLTENLTAVEQCIDEDHGRVLREVVDVSQGGLAPKNDQAILVLAMLVSRGAVDDRRTAADSISTVCRTGTHLFQFCEYAQNFRGWGRVLRTGVAAWYEQKDAKSLAYQVLKYRSREGWTHRRVLRVAHPKAVTSDHAKIYDFACGREWDGDHTDALAQIAAFESTTKRPDANAREVVEAIKTHRMTREMVNPEILNDKTVATALTEGAPMTALIRNLGNLTANEILVPNGDLTATVIEKITSEEAIRAARVHPFSVLIAQKTYAQGHGMRGGNAWTPIPKIVKALDDAYYKAFVNVEPTGKRWLLAFDISASMSWSNVAGLPLIYSEAAFAMGAITERVETRVTTMAFATKFTPIDISGKRLDDILATARRLTMGGTDCSLPMKYAIENDLEVDAFVVYTDNETWYGDIHPAEALKKYRRASGIDAKLIVVSLAANGDSIADPNDAGMLDVVGCDASTPRMIAAFGAGQL